MSYASEWAKKTEKWFDKFEPETGILHEVAEIFSDDYRKHLFNTTVSGGSPIYGYITDYYQAENEGDSGWQRTGQNLGRSAAILASIFGLAGAGGAAGGEAAGGGAAGGEAAAGGGAAGGEAASGGFNWQNLLKNMGGNAGGGGGGGQQQTSSFQPEWDSGGQDDQRLRQELETERQLREAAQQRTIAQPQTYANETAALLDAEVARQREALARDAARQQAMQEGIGEATRERWGMSKNQPGQWSTLASYV